MRCDMCGPYTPEKAAALVLETWKPEPTWRVCERCRPIIAAMAQDLAEAIDARLAAEIYDASGRVIAPAQAELQARPSGPHDANGDAREPVRE